MRSKGEKTLNGVGMRSEGEETLYFLFKF